LSPVVADIQMTEGGEAGAGGVARRLRHAHLRYLLLKGLCHEMNNYLEGLKFKKFKNHQRLYRKY
jgi:hypothetical protein